MFEEVDKLLAAWQEKVVKVVVFTTTFKTPALLTEVATVTAEMLATVCCTAWSREGRARTRNLRSAAECA
jgi:hypothetical protein